MADEGPQISTTPTVEATPTNDSAPKKGFMDMLKGLFGHKSTPTPPPGEAGMGQVADQMVSNANAPTAESASLPANPTVSS